MKALSKYFLQHLLRIGKISGRIFQHRSKPGLVIGLHVGFVRIYPALIEKIHYGIVKKQHPKLLAGLYHGVDLERLALTDQIPYGRVGNENLHGCTAALFVYALEEHLGNHSPQSVRQGRSNLGLLTGGEYLDDTIHGFGCTGCMQGTENQMAGGRGVKSGLTRSR